MELARCDLVALDGVLFGEECAHVLDKGAGYCRRYFQLFPGHTTKIIVRIRPCESQEAVPGRYGGWGRSWDRPPTEGGLFDPSARHLIARLC
jgi:hypothetical protein